MKPLLKPNEEFIKLRQEHLQEMLDTFLTENTEITIGVKNIMDLDQEDFAAARNDTFGASDSSVLLGVPYSSKYVEGKTRETLLYEKVNNVWDEEIGKLASVRKGRELEEIIIEKFEEILNMSILKPAHMYINGKGLATNFDGVIFKAKMHDVNEIDVQPIPFEIKLCSFFGRKNYDWNKGMSEFATDLTLRLPEKFVSRTGFISDDIIKQANYYGIPKYYYTQLQQQIAFLNAPYGLLGVMDDINWELYVYVIHRDDKTIEELLKVSLEDYLKLCKRKGIPRNQEN